MIPSSILPMALSGPSGCFPAVWKKLVTVDWTVAAAPRFSDVVADLDAACTGSTMMDGAAVERTQSPCEAEVTVEAADVTTKVSETDTNSWFCSMTSSVKDVSSGLIGAIGGISSSESVSSSKH